MYIFPLHLLHAFRFMRALRCEWWPPSTPPPPPPFSPWSHFPFFSSTTVSVAVSASVLWPLICIPGGAKRRPQRRADKGHGRSPRGSMFATHPPRRHDTCRRPPSRHSHTHTHRSSQATSIFVHSSFTQTPHFHPKEQKDARPRRLIFSSQASLCYIVYFNNIYIIFLSPSLSTL